MSWQEQMVTSLRVLIGDMAEPPTYSDSRLESIIVVAANIVKQDITFSTNYTIDVVRACISPDPVTNNDDIFINFVLLKSACFVDQWTYRSAALTEGVKVKAGPTDISVTGRAGALKGILDSDVGPCKLYEDAKKDYLFSGGLQIKAVLSPFISNDFDPADLNRTRSLHREVRYS